MLEYETLSKDTIVPHLDALAQLRLGVYLDYPYLYRGTVENERSYLSKVSASEKGITVVAKVGDLIVGVATGMPFVDQPDAYKDVFIKRGEAIDDLFYFGEALVLPRYRGQGSGQKFVEFQEEWARSLGLKRATFCSVVRPSNHPLRPRNYNPGEPFWTRRGYSLLPDYVAQVPWKEVGEDAESLKTMQFWIGDL
jgi:GNAT superfamily N-acetyltransferase